MPYVASSLYTGVHTQLWYHEGDVWQCSHDAKRNALKSWHLQARRPERKVSLTIGRATFGGEGRPDDSYARYGVGARAESQG